LIFFKHVKKRKDHKKYAQEMDGVADAKAVSEVAEHCYHLSGLCSRKYTNIKWAVSGFGAMIVLEAAEAGLLIWISVLT